MIFLIRESRIYRFKSETECSMEKYLMSFDFKTVENVKVVPRSWVPFSLGPKYHYIQRYDALGLTSAVIIYSDYDTVEKRDLQLSAFCAKIGKII